MLTSTKNPRIQHIRKLQNSARVRRKAAAFVIEGVRLLEEAFSSGWQPELLLYTEDINKRGHKVVAHFRDSRVEILLVSGHVMRAVSDTQTPQGILAVLPIPKWEFPADPVFLLILDGLRDPGNLGTLLRTALAAGVEAVILPPGGVDAFSPKVVRAGMGAQFKLPVLMMGWDAIKPRLAGLTVFLADPSDGQPYFKADFSAPSALIIGGEAAGASSQAAHLATHRVHIPMPGGSESLNAGIAGGILMFEVLRQRG
jgi:TrmH family RNA methyltransferase